MSGLQKALFKKKWVMMSDPRLDNKDFLIMPPVDPYT